MGALLMQYEYQIAVAKKTMYERKGIDLNQKHEIYTKRIEKVTELFNKRENRIESDYNRAKSQLSSSLAGVRTQAADASGFASALMGCLGGYATSLGLNAGSIASEITGLVGSKTGTEATSALTGAISTLTSKIESAMQALMDAAKEKELAELEDTKNAQLEPLTDKDTELQVKIATNETLTDFADQRAEKAKARLQKDVPNTAASYGLS